MKNRKIEELLNVGTPYVRDSSPFHKIHIHLLTISYKLFSSHHNILLDDEKYLRESTRYHHVEQTNTAISVQTKRMYRRNVGEEKMLYTAEVNSQHERKNVSEHKICFSSRVCTFSFFKFCLLSALVVSSRLV